MYCRSLYSKGRPFSHVGVYTARESYVGVCTEKDGRVGVYIERAGHVGVCT